MALAGVTNGVHSEVESIVNLDSTHGNPVCGPSENVIIVGGAGGKKTESLQPVDDSDRHDGGAHSSDGTTDPIRAVTSTTDDVAKKTEYLSEPARRWTRLRQNFRLAALRSIAQDKREALKKLQEGPRDNTETSLLGAGVFGPSLQAGGSNALGYIRLKHRNVGTISREDLTNHLLHQCKWKNAVYKCR
ncbi:unnamed protein product [Ectocarpus sp. 12 AP-2014]